MNSRKQCDGGGKGPTAWARKGIEEHRKGKQVVLMLPVQSQTPPAKRVA